MIQYIPKETEAKLGEMVYKNMVETKNIDVQKTKLINDFWREMGYATNYPIKITVVNDGGSADLTNHNLFTDRFNGIQHPTSAIVGLDQALAEAGKLKEIGITPFA